LAHRLAHDRETAHFAFAIHNLLIGKHGSELFAPPNRLLADVSQTFGITVGAAAGFNFRRVGRAVLCPPLLSNTARTE
jgi:hypothetical protein